MLYCASHVRTDCTQAMFLLVPDPSLEDAGLRELWQELQIKVNTLSYTITIYTTDSSTSTTEHGLSLLSCHCSAVQH
jgi:8-oxo-dGTP pyrophosphatase MutT (NUDIX family)